MKNGEELGSNILTNIMYQVKTNLVVAVAALIISVVLAVIIPVIAMLDLILVPVIIYCALKQVVLLSKLGSRNFEYWVSTASDIGYRGGNAVHLIVDDEVCTCKGHPSGYLGQEVIVLKLQAFGKTCHAYRLSDVKD